MTGDMPLGSHRDGKDGNHVGADGHKSCLAQGEQARKAGQQVHGNSHHRIDGASLQNGYLVAVFGSVRLQECQETDDYYQGNEGI